MNHLQIGGDDSVEAVFEKTTVARQWLDVPVSDFQDRAPEVVLRVSAHIPAASPAVVDVFEPAFRRLTAMSKGAIAVQAHWGGALHNEREGIEALRSGLTDMCPVYSAWDAQMFPAAQILSLPFSFPSAEVATQVAEEMYHGYFKGDFERQGVLMGRMVATSEYNLFSRNPIRTLEDLAGQKIACSPGLEAQLFEALGAVAVGCSTPQAKQKFADQEVFAVSISDSAAHTVGLYREAAYRTAVNLLQVNLEYGLSKDFYQRLSMPLRLILNQWLRGLAQTGAQLFYGLAGARAREAFNQAGLQSLTLSVPEQARWREKLSGVESVFLNELNTLGYPAVRMRSEMHALSKKYAQHSANDLMQNALNHPLMNLLPSLMSDAVGSVHA
jgi:TRAP-type C4-dicarboxylate transport system substrate-binding protein